MAVREREAKDAARPMMEMRLNIHVSYFFGKSAIPELCASRSIERCYHSLPLSAASARYALRCGDAQTQRWDVRLRLSSSEREEPSLFAF